MLKLQLWYDYNDVDNVVALWLLMADEYHLLISCHLVEFAGRV